MAEKLHDQLIGVWELVSYVEKPLNGAPPSYPMGERPMGIIMYTPDEYMSAQLMRSNPGHFASDDEERLCQTSSHSSEERAQYFLWDIWSFQCAPPPPPRKPDAYQVLPE